MDPNRVYSWQMPVRLVVGPGCSRLAGDELGILGGSKALVVTGPNVRAAGVLDGIIQGMERCGVRCEIYDGVEPDPSIRCVEEAAVAYRSGGCDCLLGVGGGSSMDTAKVVGAMTTSGMAVRDMEGIGKLKNPIPPLVLVPTTCGTGSEVTAVGVVTDLEHHYKIAIISPVMYAKVALIDSILLTRLPGPVAASTGMDAFCHALESYTNLNTNPFSDALDLRAIGLISEWLRPAVANGNPEATARMLEASTMAGMGFANTRLTVLHAMSHPLTGFYGVPHGVANAVLLPHWMEMNLLGNALRFADIARAMGEDISGLTTMEAAKLSVRSVRELCCDVGIPGTLKQYGVTEEHLDAMVDDTFKSTAVPINPVRVTRDMVTEIYRRAMR